MRSNPLGNVHPFRAIAWIEAHFKIDTPNGLLPVDLELQIWRLYLQCDPPPVDDTVANYLRLMHLCDSGDA
jgi:hypothetical protein